MKLSPLALVLAAASVAAAQTPDATAALHWRAIGPTRAGRARALAGVAGKPTVLYIGFDNGGLWRSSDYGVNWEPLFDQQPTGSIGAIAVAPTDTRLIYVGSGAGVIPPDLATGNGMYKPPHPGPTGAHPGPQPTQQIAV